MKNNPKEGYGRPADLLKSVGIDYKGLSEEERAMQKLLLEDYKRRGIVFVDEVKKWREANPQSSFNDAVKALYNELENK